MGAWGEGPFENDGAADWAFGFDGVDAQVGVELITQALRSAAEVGPEEYLDAGEGEEAVAAMELVASLRGRPAPPSVYAESAGRWVEDARPEVDDDLVRLATAAFDRVMAGNSELAELWDESGPEWRATMDDLRTRLLS